MDNATRLVSLMRRIRDTGTFFSKTEELGISPSQMDLLARVWACPACGVDELAEMLSITSASVSVGVKKLEARGWLRREADEADKRASHLYLTELGEELTLQARAFHETKARGLLSGLTEAEQNTLLALLEKTITKYEEENK